MRRGRPLAVLCLLLALLPLRGWAALVMHLPANEPAAAAAPCHAGVAEESGGAASGPTAETCVLRDLCHGAALPAGPVAAAGTGLPAQPAPDTATPPPRTGVPDPLFRPPRG